MMELEHKFSIPSDIYSRLTILNAKWLKDVKFTDHYLDDESNTLALADTWLRVRNECLELKYPPQHRTSSALLQYCESTDKNFIEKRVAEILKSPAHNIVESLKTFAKFETHRQSYAIEGVLVELDQTDFGYSVGEVEVLVDSVSEVEHAEFLISEVLKKLNVEVVSHNEGKMQRFLHLFNKDLYAKLVEAQVI